MGARDAAFGFIREAFSFGKVLATAISDTTLSLLAQVEGDEGDADNAPVDDDVWGDAPLLYRPVAPDATGHCEALFYRLGDERVVIATKDRRWQISVEEGEVIVRSMGAGSPAYVHLKPDGSVIVSGATINLGGAATQYVALANLVASELGNVWKAIETHIHTSAAPGSPTTPPTTIAAATVAAGWFALATAVTVPGSVAASKTKAE